MVAENVDDGVVDIMDMDVVELFFVHRRTGKDLEEVIVIDPVRLAGTEQDPITVKNNKLQHEWYYP
jgi:hypothetical protein